MLMILFLVLLMTLLFIFFADEMKAMFEMSMVGELTYFLGLQVKQWTQESTSTKQNMQEI